MPVTLGLEPTNLSDDPYENHHNSDREDNGPETLNQVCLHLKDDTRRSEKAMADRKFPPGMLADYYQDLLPKEAELAGADLDRVEQALEAEFEQALIDCGISKKGAGFARVAWHAIGDIFAALPLNEEPFGAADMVYRLLRHKASEVRQERRDLAYLRELSQVRKKAQKARKRVAKGGSR